MQTPIAISFAIILLLFTYFIWSWYRYEVMRWTHRGPIENYHKLRAKYGRPCHADYNKGGFAVWGNKRLSKLGSCYHEIMIRDESVPHCIPNPHTDNLYHFIRYNIPKERVFEVIKLSGSISYDPLKKLLRVRGDSEETNVAILHTAVKIATGEKSFKSDKDRIEAYSIAINDAKDNVAKYTAMYNELSSDIKKQPNVNLDGYFPLAFPSGCCAGYDPVNNKCSVHTSVVEDPNVLVQNFEGMPKKADPLFLNANSEIKPMELSELEDNKLMGANRSIVEMTSMSKKDKCKQRLTTMASLSFNDTADNVEPKFDEKFHVGCKTFQDHSHKPRLYKHVTSLHNFDTDKEMKDKSLLTNLKSDSQSLSGSEIEAKEQNEPYMVRSYKYF